MRSPTVAGTVAQALLEARRTQAFVAALPTGVLCRCFGHDVTASELRAALNASGTYWTAADYSPQNYSTDPVSKVPETSMPIGPKPWTQMGWGYVGPGNVANIVAALRGTGAEPSAEASAYMARQQALREDYWSTHPTPAVSSVGPLARLADAAGLG